MSADKVHLVTNDALRQIVDATEKMMMQLPRRGTGVTVTKRGSTSRTKRCPPAFPNNVSLRQDKVVCGGGVTKVHKLSMAEEANDVQVDVTVRVPNRKEPIKLFLDCPRGKSARVLVEGEWKDIASPPRH